MIKIFVLLAALGVAATSVLGYQLRQWWQRPLTLSSSSPELVYTVKPGSSLSKVAYDLNSQNVLTFPKAFVLIARLQGDVQIHVGEYRIEASDTPATLLDKLRQGQIITYQVTLVEGWTFGEILARLHARDKLIQTLNAPDKIDQFFQSLEIEKEFYSGKTLTTEQKLEGWFFPDTYQYSAGHRDVDVLRQAYMRMRDILATEWENRGYDLPYQNIYQTLIMASIVERETGVPQERQQIAGVFVRRLQNKMRLQTDPTVIYGLGDSYQGNLRRRHLSQATPYNTYVIFGLPPTPIAAPGREAIHAALHPDDGGALYFVARGDGSHHFSETLQEHNAAVQRYQVRQRADNYRSSPSESSSMP